MKNQICQLSLRCLYKALRPFLEMSLTNVDLSGLKIGYFAEQADNKGYIIVLDRVDS